MLFNAFLNDFFFYIRKASVHNFAVDNTLSSFAKSVTLLVEILMAESQNAMKWFSENNIIVNPDKFQSIILQRSNQTCKPKQFLMKNDIAEAINTHSIHTDDQLQFNLHISAICKSASKQLNALVRLKCFLGFEKGKVLINSFILSTFNYCPLVWSISSAKSLNKVENLQKRALRFLPDEELFKSGKSTVNVSNFRSLCIEIFKTLNDIRPSFIKDIFKLRMTNRPTEEKYNLNLEIPKLNQVRFGTKS